jgi:hypothetical protein
VDESAEQIATAKIGRRCQREGFQNVGSCCGSVVFVDQATESVTTFDLR